MEINKAKSIIEAILFSTGRPVTTKEFMMNIEISEEEIENIIANMQEEYKKEDRGIEIIKIENSYQLATKKELYEYIYPILDKRTRTKSIKCSIRNFSNYCIQSKNY